MVWYGMVWYGVVWCGVVRHGKVRYGTVRYGAAMTYDSRRPSPSQIVQPRPDCLLRPCLNNPSLVAIAAPLFHPLMTSPPFVRCGRCRHRRYRRCPGCCYCCYCCCRLARLSACSLVRLLACPLARLLVCSFARVSRGALLFVLVILLLYPCG